MHIRQSLALVIATLLVTLLVTPISAQEALFDAPVRNPGQKQSCNPCIEPPVNHNGPGTNFDGLRRIVTGEAMRLRGVNSFAERLAQFQAAAVNAAAVPCVKTDVAAGPTFRFDDATETWGTNTTWYGTPSFALLIRSDPVYAGSDKFFWYSAGFRPEQSGELNATIRQVGADASTAITLLPTNARFDDRWHMLTGIDFPVAGCWEIRGEFNGQQLTVVVESVTGD